MTKRNLNRREWMGDASRMLLMILLGAVALLLGRRPVRACDERVCGECPVSGLCPSAKGAKP
jgi:hypothetical protein